MSADRILIFSPHPDDVELFMGGSMLKHLHEGAAVRVVLMSYGEKGSILSLLGPAKAHALKVERMDEVRSRYERIPRVEIQPMDLPDMTIQKTEDLILKSLKEYESFNPTLVYLPESDKTRSSYTHPDHIHTGQIAEAAAGRYLQGVACRHYHSKISNCFVDVSPYHRENVSALRCYKSQYRWSTGIPFLLHIYEINRYFRTRKLGKRIGTTFAEDFREVR